MIAFKNRHQRCKNTFIYSSNFWYFFDDIVENLDTIFVNYNLYFEIINRWWRARLIFSLSVLISFSKSTGSRWLKIPKAEWSYAHQLRFRSNCDLKRVAFWLYKNKVSLRSCNSSFFFIDSVAETESDGVIDIYDIIF